MDIVIIPTERGIIHSRSLLSKRKEGTIRIDLIPQVLLINGISNVIDIRRMSDGMNVSVPSNGMYPVSIEDVSGIITVTLIHLSLSPSLSLFLLLGINVKSQSSWIQSVFYSRIII